MPRDSVRFIFISSLIPNNIIRGLNFVSNFGNILKVLRLNFFSDLEEFVIIFLNQINTWLLNISLKQ